MTVAVAAKIYPSFSVSLQPPVISSRVQSSSTRMFRQSQLIFPCGIIPSRPQFCCQTLCSHVLRAIEESQEGSESETKGKVVEEAESTSQRSEPSAELKEIGIEIKKALEQRKEKGEDSLLSGVAEEVQEIEWPVFGKVLGTTGVVLGVITGSSVVLLTVNAILAEISDRVFAGKGIQDFFG